MKMTKIMKKMIINEIMKWMIMKRRKLWSNDNEENELMK